MIVLVYDTETTGLPLFNNASDDPRQPHIVQLAARLVDLETHKILGQIDVIIKPENWTIPQEVSVLHGVTQDMAEQVGVSEELAVSVLTALWKRAGVRVAHNESFDARIVRIALKRFGGIGVDPDVWKEAPAECTADMATPLCRLPPTAKMIAAGRGRQFKRPTLTEAYRHFFGVDMVGSHSADGDAEACLKVYMAVKGRLA